MKKLILFLCLGALLCSFKGFSQSLEVSPATVGSEGGTVTITANGELPFRAYKGELTFRPLEIITDPAGYWSVIKIEDLKQIQKYQVLGSKPSKWTFKISKSLPLDLKVTIAFTGALEDLVSDSRGPVDGNPSWRQSVTVTLKAPAPQVFYNQALPVAITKNNCGAGTVGSKVTYTVPANKYSSTVSQQDADSKALADVNANGQNFANANGQCLVAYYNVAFSGSFTKNNCSAGTPSGPVVYNVPAGKHVSTVSQADADAKASADLSSNGQAYANANGGCILPLVIDGPTSVFRGDSHTYIVQNTLPGDTFDWTFPSTAGTILSESGKNYINVLFKNIAGTAPYPFDVQVVVTSLDGTKKTVSLRVVSKFCGNCPK